MRHVLRLSCVLAAALAGYGPAHAATVAYTGYAIADGQLGTWNFSQAMVTIRFVSDTRNVTTFTENGVTAYRNDAGYATVTISQGTTSVSAHIAAHQIYVRSNPTNGSAGFGSYAVGPYYPLVLSCYGNTTCDPAYLIGGPDGEILPALADITLAPADTVFYSPALMQVESDLKGPALLTGYTIACAYYDPNNFSACQIPSSQAISTDHGNLVFTDQYGGSSKGFLNITPVKSDD